MYTVSSPGGWHLLGRTARPLFDPLQDPPALLRAGDRVKFIPAMAEHKPEEELEEEPAEQDSSSSAALTSPWIEILAPGPMTTVQDIGRHGYAKHGVSRSGAASRRRDSHFADALSPSLLKNLLKVEGLQQNDSLADG